MFFCPTPAPCGIDGDTTKRPPKRRACRVDLDRRRRQTFRTRRKTIKKATTLMVMLALLPGLTAGAAQAAVSGMVVPEDDDAEMGRK
jgi:hypothetical protein